jgi:signal peptidase I
MLLTLLSDPPGSWFYYFGLLIALEAPAALALHHWWTTRSGASARAALAGGVMFALRALTLLAGLLIPAGTPEALAVLPPLDRAAGLLSIMALYWALANPRAVLGPDLSALALAAVVVLALALTWEAWAGAVTGGAQFFNGEPLESAWTVAALALLGLALWALAARRPPGWRPGLAVLGVLALGYSGHYLFPVAGASAAGLVRWAELLALPLGAALLFYRARSGALAAADLAPPRPAPAPARRPRSALRQVAETVLITVIVYSALDFATGRFRVNGPSMQPNLHTGQFVLADRTAYLLGPPRRGDVVVVRPPPAPDEAFIKRVIGLPGETVAVAGGVVRVDGRPLVEPYIAAPPNYAGAWTLAPDEYLVLGDNRTNSSDSHIWGPVRRDAILGKALAVYWPLAEWTVIAHARQP